MKRGVLLVAFGAGNEQSAMTLRRVQGMAEERFGLPVRWAFTSATLRERLAKARTKSDSVLKALERMRFERYDSVAVQSLHLIPGMEYSGVLDDASKARAENFAVDVGQPLLTSESDVEAATLALLRHLPEARRSGEHIICMGHGSGHEAHYWYGALAARMAVLDTAVHVACMKGGLPLSSVMRNITGEKVWLMPLLSVVGKHTLQDMAGAKATSWKSRLEKNGWHVQPDLRGLADSPDFARLWLDKLAAVLGTVEG